MVKNIGGSTLEQFQLEAKRLLELNRREQPPAPASVAEKQRPGDRVSLGQEKPEPIGYEPAAKDVDLSATFVLLRDLVARTFQEQGVATRIATADGEIDLVSLTPAEAQELIAEDGYFGVAQTSDRIVQFAIGMAGNDPSRIDAIRRGIEDGFGQAEAVWGGELPEISYQTYDAIMEKLDNWIASFASDQTSGDTIAE
ncbi:MAG: hypothetical protein P8X63_14720 [Desulfuromonadaceae bacterium]